MVGNAGSPVKLRDYGVHQDVLSTGDRAGEAGRRAWSNLGRSPDLRRSTIPIPRTKSLSQSYFRTAIPLISRTYSEDRPVTMLTWNRISRSSAVGWAAVQMTLLALDPMFLAFMQSGETTKFGRYWTCSQKAKTYGFTGWGGLVSLCLHLPSRTTRRQSRDGRMLTCSST